MSSLLSSSHIESVAEPTDAVAEKLLQTLKEHRPSSSHSNISLRAPSAKSNRSSISTNTALSFKATQRRSISQLDSEPDPSEHNYLLHLNYEQQMHQFDQKTTEKIIEKRISGKETKMDHNLKQFEAYPDFYANYHPTLPFKHKKLEETRVVAGKKQLERENYEQFLSSMEPANRAKRPDLNEYRSILTDELDKCSLDIAVRIEELQLKQQGYSDEAINAQIERDQEALNQKPPVFNTISDKIAYEQAQEYNEIISRDELLGSQVLEGQRGFQRSRKSNRENLSRSYLETSDRWTAGSAASASNGLSAVADPTVLTESAPPQRPYK